MPVYSKPRLVTPLPQPAPVILPADARFADYVADSDFGFRVSGYVDAQFDKPVSQWRVRSVESYLKCYGIDAEEFAGYRDKPHCAVFVAWRGALAVGHVVISTDWNNLAHIEELAVIASARRSGVARALLARSVEWARGRDLPGLMLETQNNNIGACRLYEGFGFTLGGIDRMRYRGIDQDACEAALFWYLMF